MPVVAGPGLVGTVAWPAGEGIRVDSHIVSGSRITPYYDSLLAKLIASAPHRATALARKQGAVDATRIAGIESNLEFHAIVLEDAEFQAGGVDTGFVGRLLARRAEAARTADGFAPHG